MAPYSGGMFRFGPARPPRPLPAEEAARLRDRLGRLVSGEGGGGVDGPPLDPEAARALRLLSALLAEHGDDGAPRAPLCLAIVAVDGLGPVRQLDEAQGRALAAVLARRIAEGWPGATLRRTGRSRLEFAVRARDPADTLARMTALQEALEARLELDGQSFDFPITIGYAVAEPDAPVDERLIEAAEHALARAQARHHKVGVFDHAARAEQSDRLALMRDLRRALDGDDVFLCYQPKVEARTGRITAVEALIRWRHPERGLVPPDRFISLAEKTGEIRGITERVVRRAIADQARLHDGGLPVAVHVNLSGALIGDDRFVAWLLARTGEAAGEFGVEVTETAALGDAVRARAHMQALADAGLTVAIDDYGSGLSSLNYLKALPAHELKIDKLFILGLTGSHRDPLIVRSTIELAHALGMKVTAEGVDNPTSRALLTVMGCDHLQGYEIGEPLRIDALADRLRAEGAERAALGPVPGAVAR